MSIIQR